MLETILAAPEAIAVFIACVAAGLLADYLLMRVVTARAKAAGSSTLAQLAAGLRGAPTAIGALVGLWALERMLQLDPAMRRTFDRAFVSLAIVVVTAFSARIASRVVRAVTEREDVPLPSGSIFVNLTRAAIWLIGIISLLGTLGVSVAPLVTALGVGGLAVGLALQPTLENVFSGVQLLASRQIKPGDFIRLETGEEGTVLDVTWRNTLVQQPTNDIAIVPNSVLARATVVNYSTVGEFVLVVPVAFASAGDPDAVERIALEVAREVIAECEGAVKCSEPGARFADLTPPAAVLNVSLRCRTYPERIGVRHEFIRRLARRFSEEGIQAPPVPFSTAKRR
ncbi:MAG: mechanosensitive ion channel family protein [Coriobacteriia bacterium]|nr:mechanosensitive ion channel family protein [Coriobacteriia bacterium]